MEGESMCPECSCSTNESGNAAGTPPGYGSGVQALAEIRLRALMEASPDGMAVVDLAGRIVEVGGWLGAESVGLKLEELAIEAEGLRKCVEAALQGEKAGGEFELAGETRRWAELHLAPLRDAAGAVTGLVGILRDTTARRDQEKQFIQAQKMEVVGHLAGGVAHDFNNILGIVMGYTEMLLAELPAGTQEHEHARIVFHASERAAALTRQLLMFSSEKAARAEVLDLSEIITNMDRMLRRLIGENVRLRTMPEPQVGKVQGDACQVEQVLMNLTVNARDAMPNGGTITIETGDAAVRGGELAHAGVPPGDYVTLTVTDTGMGMTEEVRSRIFDAFFTTKPAGKGTGLGLATCQSIVRNWGGHITVRSALGVGTVFKVYFPRLTQDAGMAKGDAVECVVPRGIERILLVEDEPGLLDLTATVLTRQGYTVLKATNGREALSMIHDPSAGEIDLVVTDMVMPEMGGKMMADWLRVMRPGMRMLFTSGYTDVGSGGSLETDMDFLHKPYTPTGLLRKMREVLDVEKSRSIAA
jgi:two-component system cell cycle sensor histidine kinase/response regulator CckA